ncbi:MAG: type II secretion system protein GspC [Kofleriaceae bacterium]
MQELIKRYFWLLGVVTVIVCSTFAAKATGHILEGKFLGDPKTAPKLAVVARPDSIPAKPVHTKDGTQFQNRNMFCSECTPPVVVNTDPSSIAVTTLPLQLLATNVSTDKPETSYATIINTESHKQGAYSVNDRMPGASGVIKSIHFQYVDFENNGRVERVVLHGANPPPVAVAAAPPPSGEPSKDDMQAQIDAGIKKTGENTYELDKGLMDKVLANPMAWVKGARVVPSVQNGKSNGFKLYAIRPNSAYAKLGLSNGDTISSINGFELTTVDKALEVYTKLREATSLELEVVRRGKPVTMKYTIR